MKFLILGFVLSLSMCSQAFALNVRNLAGTNLGQAHKVRCSTGLACTVSAAQLTIKQNGLQNRITAVSPTLTVTDCGSTVTNTAASTAVLPEASTVLGCRFTFIVGHVSNFGINPADASDTIVLLTNAAGDSIIADAIGESVTLEALANDTWAPVGAVQGTWTDSN